MMRRFDCTARECPLFGPHLLEASAGTGKTFSIEHVFARLLIESGDNPIELEQILAVTFTRAAARELKARIRSNLDRAISFLEASSSKGWDYLTPFAGSEEVLRRLREARGVFDSCHIFTIHSFCYRMLREFAFEAHLGFSLPDPDKRQISKQMKREVCHFLETLKEDLLCPEQMMHLLKDYESLEELGKALLKAERCREEPLFFSELHRKFIEAIENWEGSRECSEFQELEKGYKKVEGDLQKQVFALAEAFLHPEDPAPLRALIWEKGSLFEFFTPENRKKRAVIEEGGFFEKASEVFGPLLREAIDRKKLFATLAAAWQKEAREWVNPDEILFQMKLAMRHELFARKVQEKYSAVIIDEFQDTDPLQWEIFHSLFLERKTPLRAFYLVGDPKQSIYRFRNADVYTYLKAREILGEGALYSLDTNFRSSKKLLGALNALFHQSSFPLPKANRALAYTPVKAGAEIETFEDGKGAVHAVFVKEEREFLPFAVSEMERLLPQGTFAILVKDRYQAEEALQLLSARGIPAFAKSHTPLGKTETFRAVRELFEAVVFPRDSVRTRIVQAGPFAHLLLPDQEVLRQGLVPFFNRLKVEPTHESDWKQLVEELLAWEQREGFSLEGLLQFLDELERADSEDGGRRRLESEEDAVQILTMHISKGLEFDVVFAWGLAAPSPEGEEEDAEKLRQLYVAMTRAKKRLYFPIASSARKKGSSPMELFLGAKDLSYYHSLAEKESFTFEEIPTSFALPPRTIQQKASSHPKEFRPLPYRPSFLHSFTTLAREKIAKPLPKQEENVWTMQSLPRGTETGIAIHQIFERLFSADFWHKSGAIERLVAEEMRFSPLKPWEKAICQMIEEVLSLPLLEGFALKDLALEMFLAEMEFLFEAPPHFVKGFIDLIFCWKGKYYFLDWKTNWLEEYHAEALAKAMEEHDYGLQASLYSEALKRHLKNGDLFGGAFYVFVRGAAFQCVSLDSI